MMQEHNYVLYMFTVQSNRRVATTPLLVDFEDFPYPWEGPTRFCIKITARDTRVVIKNHFA